MYMFREDIKIKINKTKASEIIGITRPNLSNILNRKMKCRKVVAYCITKYLDKNKEIGDFFNKVEE